MARPNKQERIEPWLKGLLSAGTRKADDVLAAALAAGYSARTLRYVKADLEIISERKDGVWYWRDPSVAQPKAASEDKLDVLTHEVKELKRLSQPAIPVENTEVQSTGLLAKKSKPYDPNDLRNRAIAEQLIRTRNRFEAVEGVVTSPDPFGLLESADLEETERMLLLVRNHHSDLRDELELGKWDTWIDRAKTRRKRLEAERSVEIEA